MEMVASPSDPRVDRAWVASHIDDPSVRFVEVDVSPTAYNAGHIRGALLWNAYKDLRHPGYLPINSSELQELLRRSDVAPDATVVFYGYGAHLGFWLLTSHGHPSVRLLDGPREIYQSNGEDWSTDPPKLGRSQYILGDQDPSCCPKEDLKATIGQPNRTIIDTRSKAEYDGECFWPSGTMETNGRAGHIPGAIHLPIDLLRSEDGVFRASDEILKVLWEAGIDPKSHLVTYCTIGNRASQAWFALGHLSGCSRVSVYYGSWAEWGKAVDVPVEI